jgi:tol-pal system protein YbgF
MRAEIDRLAASRDKADESLLGPEAAVSTDAPLQSSLPPVPPPPGGAGAPHDPASPGAALDPVTLGPPQSEEVDDYADTEDTSPRPNIRVFGATRPGRGAWRNDDQVEPSGAQDGAGDGEGPGPRSFDPAAKRAYDAALVLVGSKQYPQALDALAAFLVKWPDHPYAENAMYWRGESYFARGEYARASDEFEGVLGRFPAGNKAPDALLKLGMCHQKLAQPAKAKEAFDRLSQLYPQSEAARHIPPVTVPAVTPRGPAPEDHK